LAETTDQSGFEPLSARRGVGVRRYKLVKSFGIFVGQYWIPAIIKKGARKIKNLLRAGDFL